MKILDWDSEFFGFTVASGDAGSISEMRESGVRLGYVSLDHPGEVPGGLLVDRKTTFAMPLGTPRTIRESTAQVVSHQPWMDAEHMRDLAIQSGEFSRFAVDPNIPRERFESLYRTWMDKSLSKEMALDTLVATNGDQIAGMATVGEKNSRGDIGILAVDRDARGKGIGTLLVQHCLRWFADHGFDSAQVVTQGENEPACKLYAKCGFQIERVEYFWHVWL